MNNSLVEYIKRPGTTADSAAKEFETTRNTIIRRMKAYSIYDSYLTKRKQETKTIQQQSNTRNELILSRVKSGLTYTQIAEEFGLGRETVRKIAVKTQTRLARKRIKKQALSLPICEVVKNWITKGVNDDVR